MVRKELSGCRIISFFISTFVACRVSEPGPSRETNLRIQFLLFCVLSLFSFQTVYAWTIELTEDELQQKIDKRVPIEKKKLIFTVTVSAIDVELKEGSDRIGMLANMEIKSPHFSSGQGHARLDGKLTYKQDKGQFFLERPAVREVSFENIPDKYHALVRQIFQRAVEKRLANTPVYKLDKNKTRHQLAKALLKSVRVIDGRLVLEMSLF